MTLDRLQRNWDALGRTDPYWAVLTDPARKGNRWDEEEFYRTGVMEAERLMARLEAFRVPAERRRALDFGCGVGRVTLPLAQFFDEVVGADISPAMLDRARARDVSGRCCFVPHTAPHLSAFGRGRFDLVYCRYLASPP
jgi:SAM-dependent methyltransferase